MSRRLSWAIAGGIALVLSTSYLLDGPSETDAAQASAQASRDALRAAREAAHVARAERNPSFRSTTAQAQP